MLRRETAIMWELEKAILVTNNDRVYEKYKDQMKVILLDGYEDVLIKVRDLVYDKHVLLTHPQASSLKTNQTPYRSVVVYPKGEEDNINRCRYRVKGYPHGHRTYQVPP